MTTYCAKGVVSCDQLQYLLLLVVWKLLFSEPNFRCCVVAVADFDVVAAAVFLFFYPHRPRTGHLAFLPRRSSTGLRVFPVAVKTRGRFSSTMVLRTMVLGKVQFPAPAPVVLRTMGPQHQWSSPQWSSGSQHHWSSAPFLIKTQGV